jgi:hypothetical protein
MHRSPPQPATERPALETADADAAARAAVDAFVAGLQSGHDRRDARVALDPDGEPLPPGEDPERPLSEMAMYVLVRRDGDWWLAAGRTPRCDPAVRCPPPRRTPRAANRHGLAGPVAVRAPDPGPNTSIAEDPNLGGQADAGRGRGKPHSVGNAPARIPDARRTELPAKLRSS